MRKLKIAILASPLLLSQCSRDSASILTSQRPTFVMAKFSKTAPIMYNARLATTDGQIVITKDVNQESTATWSTSLMVPEGHDLYLAEGADDNTPTIPGELFRRENVAAIAVPRAAGTQAKHPLGFERLFWKKVASQSTKPESVAKNKSENIFHPRDILSYRPDIDPTYLKTKLNALVALGARQSSTGRAAAVAHLKQEYESLGFTVRNHAYGRGGVNFVAERLGKTPDKVLILSSHLDTVNTVGADDNGAGTITALAIANYLQDLDLKYTLRIVAFDQEELGLIGSEAYAQYLSDNDQLKTILGVINLEMTGYDSNKDGKFHVIDCNENTSAEISAALISTISHGKIPLTKVNACTNRSDHASFWTYQIPAVVISENFFGGDGNPCYHRTCDTVDKLNFDYMSRIATAVAKTAEATLAN